MDSHVVFLYTWFLAKRNHYVWPKGAVFKTQIGSTVVESLDVAIERLQAVADTTTDGHTGMWAQDIANFIRRYKV